MALTIKNLGIGTLGTSTADIIPAIASGTSALVENLILVNKTGTARTFTINFYDSSAGNAQAIITAQSLGANSRFVLETITLDPGDKLTGSASAASAIDFIANGVVKDL